jgi:type IV pilus assembly protein PilB
MMIDENALRVYLADTGLVGKDAYDKTLAEANTKGKKVWDLLLERGEVPEADMARAKAHVAGMQYVTLADTKVPFEVLSLIPEPVARHTNMVAIAHEGNDLTIACLDPGDLQTLDFIRKTTHANIILKLTDTASLKVILTQYQQSLQADLKDVIQNETVSVVKEGEVGGDATGHEVPALRVVDALLRHAITQQASDIHIEQHETSVLVRYRIDGILHDAMTLPAVAGPSITARLKVLSSLRLDEKRLPQDGRFKIEADGERVAFRVSTLPTHYGEKIVMRLLREGGGHFSLESLGFHGRGLELVHKALRKTTGIILITGPTGSGKTTTLYTLLDILNTPEVNISTIEDPVEYQMPSINQTQVRSDIGLTFSNGLRTLMRQDPDIIMVGEIRDTETASLAINAALTGHLVVATLHTNSASGAVPRLIDMGVEPFLLTSVLQVIIAQRLVRTLDKHHTEATMPLSAQASLEAHANMGLILKTLKDEKIVPESATMKDITFGTPHVDGSNGAEGKIDLDHTGYKGRKSIIEVLPITPTMKVLIEKRSSVDDLEKQARSEGMLTMMEDGIVKAASKITSIEEVFRVISE